MQSRNHTVKHLHNNFSKFFLGKSPTEYETAIKRKNYVTNSNFYSNGTTNIVNTGRMRDLIGRMHGAIVTATGWSDRRRDDCLVHTLQATGRRENRQLLLDEKFLHSVGDRRRHSRPVYMYILQATGRATIAPTVAPTIAPSR